MLAGRGSSLGSGLLFFVNRHLVLNVFLAMSRNLSMRDEFFARRSRVLIFSVPGPGFSSFSRPLCIPTAQVKNGFMKIASTGLGLPGGGAQKRPQRPSEGILGALRGCYSLYSLYSLNLLKISHSFPRCQSRATLTQLLE
jgi:hypothetical protein